MPERSGAESARVVNEPLRRIGRDNSLGRGTWMSLVEVFEHRELLGLLVRREVQRATRTAASAFVWSLIEPLTQLLIYYVAIGQFLGAARGDPRLRDLRVRGPDDLGTLHRDRHRRHELDRRERRPRQEGLRAARDLPARGVGPALFNFVVQFAILLVATIVLGQVPLSRGPRLPARSRSSSSWCSATALALLLSALNVYLRDVQYLVEIAAAGPVLGVADRLFRGRSSRRGHRRHLARGVYLANPITLAVLGIPEGHVGSRATDGSRRSTGPRTSAADR